jgi:hypothetical protein
LRASRPATDEDAEREKDGGDDERAQKQHRRTTLITAELFERRMSWLSFQIVRILWSFC